ncbi:sensor histidine kinase [Kiloniella laminariae]|uniref:sensor histidine kinase n=1 Tax=Kiloniella laminariae TaxID=454162 RepID=UPI0012FC02FA|nr:ATP-binding protein [Kiloniella laminariae]
MILNIRNSICGKLLSIYIPLISISLLLLFTVLESRNIHKLNSELGTRLEKMVDIQGTALSTPVWNYDLDSIQAILLALSRNPEFHSAQVYDTDGLVLAELTSETSTTIEAALTRETAIKHNSFDRLETIGSVKVSFHDALISAEIRERLIFDGLVMVVTILVLSALTFLGANSYIGVPLKLLLESIQTEKQHKNRAAVNWTSNDELGAVVTAYNDLLQKQSAYEAAVKASELRAKRSEAQLTQAIETMSEGFALYDQDDKLVLCNSNYRNISAKRARIITLGSRFEDIIRELVYAGDFVGTEGHEEEFIRETYNSHKSLQERMILHLSNGTWLQYNHRQTPAREIVVLATDITPLKNQEREIRRAKEIADQANTAKSQFLANMSHELRTPLNAILGFSEIMKSELMGPLGSQHYKSYCQDIHSSGTHLLDLINDILDLSKIEAGAFELHDETVDLTQTARAAHKLVVGQSSSDHVPVTLNMTLDLPYVRADLRAVKQILLNLLSNAVKFTPQGGEVVLSAEENSDGSLSIAVKDTGIGIPSHELERILEPFIRADTPMTRAFEGTGLGLPLVKSLMEQHGGTLKLESKINKGTTATITFPANRVIKNEGNPIREGKSALTRV